MGKKANEQKLHKHFFSSKDIQCITIVFLGFLLTSTGWLTWEYHLMEQVSMVSSDVMTMVVGYILQAVGIGVFSFIIKHRANIAEHIVMIALVAHMVCMIPAVISPYVVGTYVFGMLMNILCGIIAGYYLYVLADKIDGKHRATAFGTGYGLAIIAAWILSRIDGGSIYYTNYVLIVCVILTVITIVVVRIKTGYSCTDKEVVTETVEKMRDNDRGNRRLVCFFCVLVLLFGIVNSSAFAFPASDVGRYVNVELSRLIYAVGLIIAGFVTDKSRKYGALMAMMALVVPFVMLAIRGEAVSTVTFWVIGYLAYGFYAVYRIVLLSDASDSKRELMYLSGFGLMFGRLGDAIGEILCITLNNRTVILVCLVAVIFAVTVLVFF